VDTRCITSNARLNPIRDLFPECPLHGHEFRRILLIELRKKWMRLDSARDHVKHPQLTVVAARYSIGLANRLVSGVTQISCSQNRTRTR
jgi:hypothetical protein